MAEIATKTKHGNTKNAGIFSTLFGRFRLFYDRQIKHRTELAEPINQADAEFYDRFYG